MCRHLKLLTSEESSHKKTTNQRKTISEIMTYLSTSLLKACEEMINNFLVKRVFVEFHATRNPNFDDDSAVWGSHIHILAVY